MLSHYSEHSESIPVYINNLVYVGTNLDLPTILCMSCWDITELVGTWRRLKPDEIGQEGRKGGSWGGLTVS